MLLKYLSKIGVYCMGPTMRGIYERCIVDDVSEYRAKVIDVFKRNGIEGGFLSSVEHGAYDNRIEHYIRCNSKISPVEFVKKLIADELM